MRRHPIADRHLEMIAGLAVFAGGAWLIYDATSRRGREVPKWLRPFAFW